MTHRKFDLRLAIGALVVLALLALAIMALFPRRAPGGLDKGPQLLCRASQELGEAAAEDLGPALKELKQQVDADLATYEEARSLLYTRDFEGAAALFQTLGDFMGGEAMADWALDYQAQEPEYGPAIMDQWYVDRVYPQGTLYSLTDYGSVWGSVKYKGLAYVPSQVDENTSFVQYFAGGGDDGDYLWYSGVYSFFEEYSPNAIIVFTNESAFDHIQYRLDLEWDILRQLAYECGTVVHDLSSIGSSNGGYAALRMAYDFYAHHGIALERVCTLDTGASWDLPWLSLSLEEAQTVAKAGTKLYLFESPGFQEDLKKDAVQALIRSGVEATALICKNGAHDTISRNAYTLGVFRFSAGEDVELPDFEYYPVELYPGISSIGEPTWPDQPPSDKRKVYTS